MFGQQWSKFLLMETFKQVEDGMMSNRDMTYFISVYYFCSGERMITLDDLWLFQDPMTLTHPNLIRPVVWFKNKNTE